jgi:hypothetical protein
MAGARRRRMPPGREPAARNRETYLQTVPGAVSENGRDESRTHQHTCSQLYRRMVGSSIQPIAAADPHQILVVYTRLAAAQLTGLDPRGSRVRQVDLGIDWSRRCSAAPGRLIPELRHVFDAGASGFARSHPQAWGVGLQARWQPSELIPHRHRPRAELQPAHEVQVDMLREPREQCRPVARQPGLHHELVLIDQSQLRQRQRAAARLPRTAPYPIPASAAEQPSREPHARAPRSNRPAAVCSTRRTSCRVDGPGAWLHPIRPRSRLLRRPPRCLHHLVRHAAEEET